MRYINSYKIFEGQGHWKYDAMKLLSWKRLDDIHDMLVGFVDVGWSIPKCKIQIDDYGDGIISELFDINFNYANRKSDIVEKTYYEGYDINIRKSDGETNIELFKELVEFMSKLKGFGYTYKFRFYNDSHIGFKIFHVDDIIDPKIILGDKYRPSEKKYGIDYIKMLVSQASKIINIEHDPENKNRLFVTPKTDKYTIDDIYSILSKMSRGHQSGGRFSVKKLDDKIIVE